MQARIVLIADVVNSAGLPARAAFGRRLPGILTLVNRRHRANLQAPLAVAKGIDTLSAIFSRPAQAHELAADLTLATRPQFIRISLAWGPLDVNPRSKDPRLADGPAFHAAQDAIERLEHEAERLSLVGLPPAADLALRPALALLGLALDALTPRQAEIIFLYRRLATQEAVAAKLGITPQAVSDAFRKARADLLLRNLRRLTQILETYFTPEASP